MNCQYYKKIFFTCFGTKEKYRFICKCGKTFTHNTQLLEHQTMCLPTRFPIRCVNIAEKHKETYNHIVKEKIIHEKEIHNAEQENDGYINLGKSSIKKNDSWEKL